MHGALEPPLDLGAGGRSPVLSPGMVARPAERQKRNRMRRSRMRCSRLRWRQWPAEPRSRPAAGPSRAFFALAAVKVRSNGREPGRPAPPWSLRGRTACEVRGAREAPVRTPAADCAF